MSDERPKKSWREIDRARESGSRRDEKRGGGGVSDERSAAYRAYKSQLDKLFDGGAKAADTGADEDAIARQLDSSDEAVVSDGLAALERLLSEGKPKRAAALKARLKSVQTTIDEPKIRERARALLAHL